jgi:gamma-glutamylputrescine oxidase
VKTLFEADVVVVGGGNVGSFAALYLARLGKTVILLDQGTVGCGASGRSGGGVRQQFRDVQGSLSSQVTA